MNGAYLLLLVSACTVLGFRPVRPSQSSSARLYAAAKKQESPFDMAAALFQDKMIGLQKLFDSSSSTPNSKKPAVFEGEQEIESAVAILKAAAQTRKEEPDLVVSQLLALEKLMRARNKFDLDATSAETFKMLDGSWRLIFTTGTVDTQKKIGKINYFPIKAVQSFDTSDMKISNGIYLGDLTLLKFFGPWSWVTKARKLVFDFDEIEVFGLRFKLPKGGAAKIGSQTGLGSEGNVELVNRGSQPFFNWILADESIAVARGGGGGLALWRRDIEMQERNLLAKSSEA